MRDDPINDKKYGMRQWLCAIRPQTIVLTTVEQVLGCRITRTQWVNANDDANGAPGSYVVSLNIEYIEFEERRAVESDNQH